MTMIKTIIADDEKHARERLKELLEEFDVFDIKGEASTGTEALEMIISYKPDVAFLDINMPGISVFDSIPSLNDPPLIIFQTAYSEYATDAFDINALDYIMKPLSRERLSNTVKKIRDNLSSSTERKDESDNISADRITIRDSGSIRVVKVKDIQKICFEDGLSFIYTEGNKILSDKPLKHYEDRLRDMGFFRSSKANLVNLDCIKAIYPMFKGQYIIELKDSSRIDLSRRKARLLKKIMDF